MHILLSVHPYCCHNLNCFLKKMNFLMKSCCGCCLMSCSLKMNFLMKSCCGCCLMNCFLKMSCFLMKNLNMSCENICFHGNNKTDEELEYELLDEELSDESSLAASLSAASALSLSCSALSAAAFARALARSSFIEIAFLNLTLKLTNSLATYPLPSSIEILTQLSPHSFST